ncbi:MAG: DUF3106 domain-containing protein [Deltaproteobacteria bacterium]|nr:DUF3106 domain-containing protein [Deltaproteobacteria bacterium]MBW2387090.1 DUF3106 domain-containing protein [Deltaproteobacteria bacterium]MBW2723626.1 DUF3106 domain-containing protein [Deltaproteobacteria bacterium]
MLSIVLAALAAISVQASWTDAASAQERAERREAPRARSRDWAERLRNATPEMHEARRQRMLERLAAASPEERRRILRRQRRVMRFLSEAERRKIRRERQEFADQYDLGTPREREGWGRIREFDFTPEERRILRSKVRKLSKAERRELRGEILNMRELPEAERETLRERLHEMKSLTGDEKRALELKTRRWSQMSEERREKLRAQMRRIRALPPDERLELLERAQAAAEQGTN